MLISDLFFWILPSVPVTVLIQRRWILLYSIDTVTSFLLLGFSEGNPAPPPTTIPPTTQAEPETQRPDDLMGELGCHGNCSSQHGLV